MNLRVFGTEGSETRSDVEDLALAASAEALTLDNAPEASAEMVVNTADPRTTPVEIERPSQNFADVTDLFIPEQTVSVAEVCAEVTAETDKLLALRELAVGFAPQDLATVAQLRPRPGAVSENGVYNVAA